MHIYAYICSVVQNVVNKVKHSIVLIFFILLSWLIYFIIMSCFRRLLFLDCCTVTYISVTAGGGAERNGYCIIIVHMQDTTA